MGQGLASVCAKVCVQHLQEVRKEMFQAMEDEVRAHRSRFDHGSTDDVYDANELLEAVRQSLSWTNMSTQSPCVTEVDPEISKKLDDSQEWMLDPEILQEANDSGDLEQAL